MAWLRLACHGWRRQSHVPQGANEFRADSTAVKQTTTASQKGMQSVVAYPWLKVEDSYDRALHPEQLQPLADALSVWSDESLIGYDLCSAMTSASDRLL